MCLAEGEIWPLVLVTEGSLGLGGEERWVVVVAVVAAPVVEERQMQEEFQAQGQGGGSPLSHKAAERWDLPPGFLANTRGVVGSFFGSLCEFLDKAAKAFS